MIKLKKIIEKNFDSGQKIYYNGSQLKKIYFNDEMVYLYDDTKPVVTITSHTQSATHWMKNTSTTISGTCVDTQSGINKVTVNGVEATLSSDKTMWSLTVTYTTTPTKFEVIAYDNANNVSDTVWVIYQHVVQTSPISYTSWRGVSLSNSNSNSDTSTGNYRAEVDVSCSSYAFFEIPTGAKYMYPTHSSTGSYYDSSGKYQWSDYSHYGTVTVCNSSGDAVYSGATSSGQAVDVSNANGGYMKVYSYARRWIQCGGGYSVSASVQTSVGGSTTVTYHNIEE